MRFSGNLQSKGFSLIEVMVALAILGTAVVAIFQLFSVSLRTVRKAEDSTKALFFGRSIMDEAYSEREISEGSDIIDLKQGFKGRREVSVVTESEDGKVKLYEILVTVTWPPAGSLRMKGLRAYREPEK